MFFGVPPPNQDPRYEGEYGSHNPRERLNAVIYGIALVTLLLVIAVIIASLV